MAERPSFQFYPGAWRNNAKLRRCSRAARSVWIDILCILHDSDEYGVLRWPLADIAAAADAPLEMVTELVEKCVLKGADNQPVEYTHAPRVGNRPQAEVTLLRSEAGPCWYSSRMVLDEWRRKTKGAATRFTANDNPSSVPSRVPSHRQGNGSSSSTSSSIVASGGDDAQTTSNQLARLSKILCLPENDFNKHASNLVTLSQLKAEGCDFDSDILPAAQRAARGGASIQSLRYIVASTRESRDGRKALAVLPVAFDPTSEAGWRDRLRVWTDRAGWLPKWGPDPNHADCKCPADVLAELATEAVSA
jgi:hypothetical protein